MSNYYNAIGTMTGTSMDGLDAALIRTDGENMVEFIDHDYVAYPSAFQHQMKQLENCFHQAARAQPQQIITQAELLTAVSNLWNQYSASQEITLAELATQSYQYHQYLVQQLLAKHDQLIASYPTVIGCPGQTLYHNPQRQISWQLSAPQQLAKDCQQPVVAQLRQPDVDLGGQGAPLAPLYHQALARMKQLTLPVAIINCGGIANVSYITGSEPYEVMGFDTGPGCVLLDRLLRQRTQGHTQCDMNGYYALQGTALYNELDELVNAVFVDPYYPEYAPPKSLDSYDLKLPERLQALSVADCCATLATITGETVYKALCQLPQFPKQVILVGGGWCHPVITRHLTDKLPLNVSVTTADQIGWPNQSMEAQIFAYLAVRSLQNKPVSTPNTTGRSKGQAVGKVFMPE